MAPGTSQVSIRDLTVAYPGHNGRLIAFERISLGLEAGSSVWSAPAAAANPRCSGSWPVWRLPPGWPS